MKGRVKDEKNNGFEASSLTVQLSRPYILTRSLGHSPHGSSHPLSWNHFPCFTLLRLRSLPDLVNVTELNCYSVTHTTTSTLCPHSTCKTISLNSVMLNLSLKHINWKLAWWILRAGLDLFILFITSIIIDLDIMLLLYLKS